MPTYVALLRAVNVGGTGKLPMSELREVCEGCGFRSVQTYIASGNVVFEAASNASRVEVDLQTALQEHTGKSVGVIVRTAMEITAVLADNPYTARPPNLVHVIFLNEAPPSDILSNASGRAAEEVTPGLREIYVHYPQGQGASKLKLPAAKTGTARNINTVTTLVKLAGA